jgi:hypothetical protein
MIEWTFLSHGLIVLAGCGLYVRIVAKEKRRREKHLQLRLLEKIEQEEKARMLEATEVESVEAATEAAPAAVAATDAEGLEAA